MRVFRTVKGRARIHDLSGTGAFINGGRWNNEGTYAVYCSEHRSLALLETLVHTENEELPPNLFILELELNEEAPVLNIELNSLPEKWRTMDNYAIRHIGDGILHSKSCAAMRVPSAVLPKEFNYILNPAFPGFENLVTLKEVYLYEPDERLK